jgi:hypothetical protein
MFVAMLLYITATVLNADHLGCARSIAGLSAQAVAVDNADPLGLRLLLSSDPVS